MTEGVVDELDLLRQEGKGSCEGALQVLLLLRLVDEDPARVVASFASPRSTTTVSQKVNVLSGNTSRMTLNLPMAATDTG